MSAILNDVVLTIVCVPETVKFPSTVRSLNVGLALVATDCPILISPELTVTPVPAVSVVILPVPSNDTPPIFLAVWRAVAVAAFPVVDPELPDTFPVTSPTKP